MAEAMRLVPNPEEEPVGDASLTRETMAQWTQGQRRCRGRRRHNWNPFNVYVHATWWDVVEQCSHCKNRRHAPFVKTAYGLRKEGRWRPDYRDGYLLPRGAQRIDEDLQDELTEMDILSRRMVEVPDEDEDT